MEKRRISTLSNLAIILFLLLCLRLFDLQILHHQFYQKKSMEQHKRIIRLAAQRGDIFDRGENILVTSLDTYSVYEYRRGWLGRKFSLAEAQQLQAANPKKISILKEKKRVYPKDQLASQLIGFVGMDNQGLSGIELSMEEYLRGREGRVITEGDPEGRELYGAEREKEDSSDGMNITLTIDENIQYVAEREISKQVEKSKAASGTLIVMDAKTGEILALASKPDFNPNFYQKASRQLWHPRFLNPYEPGSTFKVITTAAGLEEGVIKTDTLLEALDSITVGGKVIENSHKIHWPGKQITVSRMLGESINTGAVQIGLKLGPEKFYQHIKAFGLGEKIGSGMAGESKGIVNNWRDWYKPDVAMISFGQSIAVTPLQLLSAFSAFTNHGIMLKPYLVKKIESLDGRFVKVFLDEERGRAISDRVASEIKELMRDVVINGSGRRARMKEFGVGGKTGTAQKAAPGGRGYLKGHYIASFIGFAPFKDPRLIGLVIVDDPKGGYWGETVCGPVFKEVIGYALRYLNVKPDML